MFTLSAVTKDCLGRDHSRIHSRSAVLSSVDSDNHSFVEVQKGLLFERTNRQLVREQHRSPTV